MASTFGIDTHLVVEIKERARPVFKKHPFKSVEDDPEGVFSLVFYGVLHNQDIRAYIHYDLEEIDSIDMISMYNKHSVDNLGNLKSEYNILKEKGFIQFIYFLSFDEVE